MSLPQDYLAREDRTEGATEETATIWAATLIHVSYIWLAVESHLCGGWFEVGA